MCVAAEDIEAGTRTRFQTEPTLPIYLKVIYRHVTCQKERVCLILENVLCFHFMFSKLITKMTLYYAYCFS